MKKFVIMIVTAVLLLCLSVRADVSPQEKYIARYAPVAVQEMYRSGVPASITLAQGLLESRYGMSPLAAEGHNHFGIKCHKDWKGKSMKVDDDEKGECFRVYDEDLESFRDHSDFLRYRDRYRFLFDYEITDYVSWANGLKKAGYATDPAYPSKLIGNIEKYNLSRYDRMKPSDFDNQAPAAPVLYPGVRRDDGAEVKGGQDASSAKVEKSAAKNDKSASRKSKAQQKKPAAHQEPVPEVLPESPSEMEEVVQVTVAEQKEEFHFTMARPVYKQNGVPFIYSREGETYSSIAEENDLFIKEILKFNDLASDCPLLPGTVVYIQAKKTQTEKGLDKYIVESDGENLRDICQRFAVRMSSVCSLNDFEKGHVLREGDTILLRKDYKTTGVRRVSLARIRKITNASKR